jgi:SecD/SecF fusion protein
VVLLIGLVALGVRGLNLGIDFKGGVQVTFVTKQPTSLTKVRNQTIAIGRSDAVVQGRGKAYGSDSYKSFQIRLKKLTSVKQGELISFLDTNVKADKLGTTNVSSSFGRQILDSAIFAIIVSLFIITIYIGARFHGIAFAGPVIIAMLHDVLITIGVYALTGREVTASTVAAVLTVLGYSIYDTIIIFDRIRENVPIMRRAPFATIANVSLWETIRRSIATTFITLLPVLALLFFGGATLQDFAFALLVGITSGAYSSIFIAAPLITIWKEREPEFARRKALGGGLEGKSSGKILADAEQAASRAPTPATPMDVVEAGVSAAAEQLDPDAKRAARKQRRQSRPHGRPR